VSDAQKILTARQDTQRLIIVSNRLPVALTQNEQGDWQARPGAGGLITALAPVVREHDGLWVGWSGAVENDTALEATFAEVSAALGFQLQPVSLTAQERDNFYLGFSNEIIWPLFHDLQSRCNFAPAYWTVYEDVNRKFAQVLAEQVGTSDYIWVHDYHLMNVAGELRELGVDAPLGFFLHIPFPPPDIFLKLPWRVQILRNLLHFDLLGFQTVRDQRNFLDCLRLLVERLTIYDDEDLSRVRIWDRTIGVGSFPISIDYREFAEQAKTPAVAEIAATIHAGFPKQQLIFSTDRLDYTKGIPQKLEAFRYALERFPELRRRVTLIQLVTPSRATIPEYSDLKTTIEQLVGQINGQFSEGGWVPIHYMYRGVSRDELLAYYRAADIALITPVKDGMNLVAKEYCATHPGSGVLILSEFAGAATQLADGAILVNPYDVEGVAEAIVLASSMSIGERERRMAAMRTGVRTHDIYWWVESFLHASGEARRDTPAW
jgi:trehalose 6-phosphate synthase/phosphatase